jgi:hypothetical protein
MYIVPTNKIPTSPSTMPDINEEFKKNSTYVLLYGNS